MNIKFLGFILFFLLGKKLFSQQEEYLNKTFYFDNGNLIQTILPTDSGYVLGCWYGNAICFVDSQANIKWLKTYYDHLGWNSFTGDMSPNALKSTSHNSYITCGVMQNEGPTANKVYSIKYSNVFDTLYLKLLLKDTVTLNNYVYNSFISSDGKYIFVGQSNNSGLIIKTDSNSNFIDSTLILKGNDASWFLTGIQLNSCFYLVGATRSYAPSNVTNYDRTDGWVVKTDLQGNEINSAAFGNPELMDWPFSFIQIYKNQYLMIGGAKAIIKDGNSTLYKNYILIIDSSLNTIKELLFDSTGCRELHDIKILPNGNFVALGRYGYYNSASSIGSTCITELYKFDNKERILFKRSLSFDSTYTESAFGNIVQPCDDNGFLIGGYIIDDALTPSLQAWLVKTDSLGCDGLQSCNDTALTLQILQPPDTICLNDTAWLHIKFKGRSAPYFIYANNTLALDSIYYPYTLPLWIDTLMPYVSHDSGIQQIIVKVKDPWGWYKSDTIQTFVKNCHAGFAGEEFYKRKIEIYPNPATTEIHIRIRGELSGEYTVTLYDMQGNPIRQITATEPETTLDISSYPQGIYNIRVLGNNMVRSEKVVKGLNR